MCMCKAVFSLRYPSFFFLKKKRRRYSQNRKDNDTNEWKKIFYGPDTYTQQHNTKQNRYLNRNVQFRIAKLIKLTLFLCLHRIFSASHMFETGNILKSEAFLCVCARISFLSQYKRLRFWRTRCRYISNLSIFFLCAVHEHKDDSPLNCSTSNNKSACNPCMPLWMYSNEICDY